MKLSTWRSLALLMSLSQVMVAGVGLKRASSRASSPALSDIQEKTNWEPDYEFPGTCHNLDTSFKFRVTASSGPGEVPGTDSPAVRFRGRDPMSLDVCYEFCAMHESIFMAIRKGRECVCFDSFVPDETVGECGMTCRGNYKQKCGGPASWSVFLIHLNKADRLRDASPSDRFARQRKAMGNKGCFELSPGGNSKNMHLARMPTKNKKDLMAMPHIKAPAAASPPKMDRLMQLKERRMQGNFSGNCTDSSGDRCDDADELSLDDQDFPRPIIGYTLEVKLIEDPLNIVYWRFADPLDGSEFGVSIEQCMHEGYYLTEIGNKLSVFKSVVPAEGDNLKANTKEQLEAGTFRWGQIPWDGYKKGKVTLWKEKGDQKFYLAGGSNGYMFVGSQDTPEFRDSVTWTPTFTPMLERNCPPGSFRLELYEKELPKSNDDAWPSILKCAMSLDVDAENLRDLGLKDKYVARIEGNVGVPEKGWYRLGATSQRKLEVKIDDSEVIDSSRTSVATKREIEYSDPKELSKGPHKIFELNTGSGAEQGFSLAFERVCPEKEVEDGGAAPVKFHLAVAGSGEQQQDCPLTHNGQLTVRCDGGAPGFSEHKGTCIEKECPKTTVNNGNALVFFGKVKQGTGDVTEKCPPTHNGELKQECAKEVDMWGKTRGECIEKTCKTKSIKSGGVSVRFGEVTQGTGEVEMPCPGTHHGSLFLACPHEEEEWTGGEDDGFFVNADASTDNKKCGAPGHPNRLFSLRGGAASKNACKQKCDGLADCAAMSGLWGKWCIGCKVALDTTAKNGAIGFVKQQAKLGGKYKIEAQAPDGTRGALAVWDLQNGPVNGLQVKWSNGGYDACISPGCDFYLTPLGDTGKYKIEAQAKDGTRGSLAVWGLEHGPENGRQVKWANGGYANCASPGCDFYLVPLGGAGGSYKIEAQAPDGTRGALAVWGLQDGSQNGRELKWASGGYDNCASPGCNFYITKLEAPCHKKADYNMGDIGDSFDGVGSAGDCQTKCAAEPECRIFVYDPVDKMCWLKCAAGDDCKGSANGATEGPLPTDRYISGTNEAQPARCDKALFLQTSADDAAAANKGECVEKECPATKIFNGGAVTEFKARQQGYGVQKNACPATHHGEIEMTCEKEVDVWTEPTGDCKEKQCKGEDVTSGDATVTFTTVNQGQGTVTLECPVGFAGHLTRKCEAETDAWTDVEGKCVHTRPHFVVKEGVKCKSGGEDLGSIDTPDECAVAAKAAGKKFFIHGGSKCQAQDTISARCPEGFDPDDSVKFYTLSPPGWHAEEGSGVTLGNGALVSGRDECLKNCMNDLDCPDSIYFRPTTCKEDSSDCASPRRCWTKRSTLLPIGHVVALHSGSHNRFARMNNRQDMDASAAKGADELPGGWAWERFTVVDAGNGDIALHNRVHNRFIRMANGGNLDTSSQKNANDLPSDWSWERFRVVDAGDGVISLHNKVHNRFIRLNNGNSMDGSAEKSIQDLPDGWAWERFKVVDLGALLPIGHTVALHSPTHDRFVRMNEGAMDTSDPKEDCFAHRDYNMGDIGDSFENMASPADCHAKCDAEPECRVFVYDPVDKMCWLKCAAGVNCKGSANGATEGPLPTDRYISGTNSPQPADCKPPGTPNNDVPPGAWAQLIVVDAGAGMVALWSKEHDRYMRMNANGDMDVSDTKGVADLPKGWTWERFTVVDGGNGHISLHSAIHNKFVRMNDHKDMDTSATQNADTLPDGWTWERFSVEDLDGSHEAGSGFNTYKKTKCPAVSIISGTATVGFDRAWSGRGRVEIECPTTHNGKLALTCAENAVQWSPVSGSCTEKRCAAKTDKVNGAVLSFPETLQGGGLPFKGKGEVQVPCPPSHTGGHIARVCKPRTEGWQRRTGECRPKFCPHVTERAPGGLPDDVTQFARTGHGQSITANCPSTHTGTIKRDCPVNSEVWGPNQGACVLKKCPKVVSDLGLVFAETNQNSGWITRQCPAGYSGSIQMLCARRKSAYEGKRGSCKKLCPRFSNGEHKANWWGSFDNTGWSVANGPITGFYRTGDSWLWNIEEAKFRHYERTAGVTCKNANWWSSFDRRGWSHCPNGYFMHGLYRNGRIGRWQDNQLYHIEEAKCCRPVETTSYGRCVNANWWSSFDRQGYSMCPHRYAMTGLFRNGCNAIYCLEEVRCCTLHSSSCSR